jgi:NAD(P)-dependent dehydrogenase (short-subunit alcohol dehydrogenase family)
MTTKADSRELCGRNAVITGAGEGIGRCIAMKLAAAGARVAVTDRDLAKAKKTAQEITGSGGTALAEELDVTNPVTVHAALDSIVQAWGRIDIWCNNAGVSSMNRFVDVTEAEWDLNLNVNAKGTFLCGQAAARQMLRQEKGPGGLRGKIINIASVAGKTGKVPFLAHYIASKFAVVGLTQAMATELAPSITVNAVCPGYVRTAMQEREIKWEASLRGTSEEAVKQFYLSDTPMGRLEEPDDVAAVVAFLASGAADFMTGVAITVSGGAWMQ